MILQPEIRAHAAFAIHAALERDRTEIATQIVPPGVIDAMKIFRLAAVVQADQCAAMGATIFERGDRSVMISGHDHRHFTGIGRAPVTRGWNFRFQTQVIPDRAFEQAFLLAPEYIGVFIGPKWNPGGSGFRPHPRR